MNLNIWKMRKRAKEKEEELKKKFKVLGLSLNVLLSRAYEKEFENFSLKERFFKREIEPYSSLKDVKKAVKRIDEALQKKEKIAVFADYDCDGICAAAILHEFFKDKAKDVIFHIPERNEGYGLNFNCIDEFKLKGVSLIITVDTGIVSFNEVEYAKKLGIDVIITDHHNALEQIPNAFSVLNPKRKDDLTKFKEISGAFVAFKLVAALEKKECEEILGNYSELLAISTIGDVMPLVCENKMVVKKGLENLKKTKNLALKNIINALFKNKKEISSLDVSFYVCPLINSSGRLNSAKDSFKLLTAKTQKEVEFFLNKVLKHNANRKKIGELMFKEAVEKAMEEDEQDVIVVYKENWNSGLAGIVAARLLNFFKKPSFVIVKEGEILTGSARSFEGFSVYEALKFASEFFLKWGGHNLAGGFSLKFENFLKFKQKILNYSKINKPKLEEIYLDCEINPSKINVKDVEELNKLAPFGQKNNEPIFLIKNAVLTKKFALSEDKHTKLGFLFKDFYFEVLLFNKKPSRFYFKVGSCFNLLVNVYVNCFRGISSVSFKMVDFRPIEVKQKRLILEWFEFERLVKNKKEDFELSKELEQPKREDFSYVYNILKNIKVFYGNCYELYLLIHRKISYFKLAVILKIFLREGILKKELDGLYFKEKKEKINLKEEILKIIKN